MIAKNEADWLAQCIESVRSIVSEIILVDTGSSDSTVAIAQAYGAKVLHRPWDDDFSAPRNMSLAQASGDWILVLDADEAIAAEDLDKLRQLTQDPSCCYEFMQRHYSNDVRISGYAPARGEYPQWERHYGGYFESNLCRLFPNGQGIEYSGRVHELVEHRIREMGKHRIVRSSIPIHHYGHTDEVKKKKNKSSLYTPLGSKKLDDQPKDWKAYFELAVEHNNSHRHAESVDAFKKSLELHPTYIQSWINLGYVLCEMARFSEAEIALTTAIKIDGNCHEAYCNLGVVYLRTSKLSHAENCFRRAVEIAPDYVNALCNLGKTLALMRRASEAANVYYRALALLPKCATAKLDLAVLYYTARSPRRAEELLREVAVESPHEPRALQLLGALYKSESRISEAASMLKRLCELTESRPEYASLRQHATQELGEIGV